MYGAESDGGAVTDVIFSASASSSEERRFLLNRLFLKNPLVAFRVAGGMVGWFAST